MITVVNDSVSWHNFREPCELRWSALFKVTDDTAALTADVIAQSPQTEMFETADALSAG